VARSLPRRTSHVLVRLTDVPLEKRLAAAARLIRYEGIVGEPALLLILAAQSPRTDPALLVPVEQARRVLGASWATFTA
jgi:hypothetical protein